MRQAILTLLLAATCEPLLAQASAPPLRVVGFQDSLTLQAGDQFIQLTPGSIGFTVPAGVKTTVLSGKAYLNADGTAVTADEGDSFSYQVSGGRAQLLVVGGVIEALTADGKTAAVGPGQYLALGGAPTAVQPAAAPPPAAPASAVPSPVQDVFEPAPAGRPRQPSPSPAPEPVPAPSPAPVPAAAISQPAPAEPVPEPAEPAAENPLTLIGDAFYKLAKIRPSEIRLVVELHPYYKLTQTYDSNIYLVPPDQAGGVTVGGGVLGSWITENTFGSKISMPLNRRHKIDSLYEVNLINYTQQPSVNNSLDQRVSAVYDYTQRRGVRVNLSESYLNTEDPAFSELTGRQRRYQNTLGGKYDNERSRLFVYGLDSSIVHHKYLDRTSARLLNRYESSSGGYAGVKLAPKTKLFLDYHRESVHYSAGRANHSKSHRIGLGISGALAPKVAGEIKAGLQLRRYELPAAGQPRNRSNLVTDLRLSYSPGRRTRIGLSFFRNVTETTFSSNRYYVGTGGRLDLKHTMAKLTAGADFGFETDRYPETTTLSGATANRRDDLYSSGLSLEYQFKKWLSAGLRFQKVRRQSVFPGDYNYDANRTSANLRVEF